MFFKTKSFNSVIIFTVLTVLLLTVTLSNAKHCQSRDFGNGATVCVCNSTYCDSLPKLEKTSKGQVQMFVTTKSGERMLRILHHFNNIDVHQNDVKRTIKINSKIHYQKIIGFGGAFTDSAGYNIAKLDNNLQIKLIEDYFTDDGIQYNLGRVPIGGSDFSLRPYTYDDNDGDEKLEKFALQEDDFKYKIPYMKLAEKVSKDKILYVASPWSAPAWMKTNRELNHGGLLIGQPGGKYYKIWAEYFVKFIQAYEKNNITIWGLTIENEPGAGFNPHYPWNSLAFNETLQRDFLKIDLGPALKKAGFGVDKVKTMIYDDQLTNVKKFSTTVLEDPEAAKYASGIAFHWYQNNNPNANRKDLDSVAKQFPDKFILATEACEEWKGRKVHVSLGNWATVNRYADDIIKDLNHHTSGWIDWNLAVDMEGGPNWVKNFVDAPIIVNYEKQEYYKQPFFYALGHFSKFLSPDSVKIEHEESHKDDNLLVTAFERPDKAIVVIVLNKKNTDEVIKLVDADNGDFSVNIPKESIQTIVWYN